MRVCVFLEEKEEQESTSSGITVEIEM